MLYNYIYNYICEYIASVGDVSSSSHCCKWVPELQGLYRLKFINKTCSVNTSLRNFMRSLQWLGLVICLVTSCDWLKISCQNSMKAVRPRKSQPTNDESTHFSYPGCWSSHQRPLNKTRYILTASGVVATCRHIGPQQSEELFLTSLLPSNFGQQAQTFVHWIWIDLQGESEIYIDIHRYT